MVHNIYKKILLSSDLFWAQMNHQDWLEMKIRMEIPHFLEILLICNLVLRILTDYLDNIIHNIEIGILRGLLLCRIVLKIGTDDLPCII